MSAVVTQLAAAPAIAPLATAPVVAFVVVDAVLKVALVEVSFVAAVAVYVVGAVVAAGPHRRMRIPQWLLLLLLLLIGRVMSGLLMKRKYGIGIVKRRMICDRRASPIFYLLQVS